MTACPNELELARAVTDGASTELTAHLATCAACTATWTETARVIDLARGLRVTMPSAERREELRTHILAAAELVPTAVASPRRSPSAWWIAGGALLAAAAAVVIVVGAPAKVHAHGTISGHAGARFATTTEAPDEMVMLHDGVIDVEVSPLHPGERFRVITADTEIEVRGTAFEVTAVLGHVTNVTVRHGRVEVRPHGAATVMLGAGEAWTSPLRTAQVVPVDVVPAPLEEVADVSSGGGAVSPSVVASPDRAPARRAVVRRGPERGLAPPAQLAASAAPAPSVQPRPAHAIAYDEAWDAMRAGNFERAAAVFARVAILDPDGALAEDASYWYPVALARAKRSEAMSAFREFLDRYPRSAHAHEASAMLGWLLVDAKQTVEAEARFRAALDDPSAQVSGSARAGLAALGVSRRTP